MSARSWYGVSYIVHGIHSPFSSPAHLRIQLRAPASSSSSAVIAPRVAGRCAPWVSTRRPSSTALEWVSAIIATPEPRRRHARSRRLRRQAGHAAAKQRVLRGSHRRSRWRGLHGSRCAACVPATAAEAAEEASTALFCIRWRGRVELFVSPARWPVHRFIVFRHAFQQHGARGEENQGKQELRDDGHE